MRLLRSLSFFFLKYEWSFVDLDEDPVLRSHTLWAWLNVNLVSAAKAIFNKTAESNGFEI